MLTETAPEPAAVAAAASTAKRHPFAEVLRTVGRGPTLSRPLRLDEAEAAMAMILDEAVEPLQLGAFLLLLRYRGETAEELAGFVRAARAQLVDGAAVELDLDWPSYADAHKQLPYFLLAALLLARNGYRILMHGLAGEGPATTRHGLAALGMAQARSPAEAAAQLAASSFAYLPVEVAVPSLAPLLALKPVLGLRSFANTMARELNPFHAPCQMQGVFHPPYLELHRATQRLLGQHGAATFKGGGGEGQRNPEKPCRVLELSDGAAGETIWPALVPGAGYPWRDEPLLPARLADLWQGRSGEPAQVAAVTGTAAVAIRLIGRAGDVADAQAQAQAMWRRRDPTLPVMPG
jgi:anthranilate phosphoribosyltransferase